VRIVTFMGNATYIKEVAVKNKLSDVYIDLSYVYSLQERTFQFLSTSDVESLKNELTSHGVNVVTYDTGVKYNDEQFEMHNRRLRIAKMIYKIANDIDDDILFVDSDVILNDDVFKEIVSDEPSTICIPCFNETVYVNHIRLLLFDEHICATQVRNST